GFTACPEQLAGNQARTQLQSTVFNGVPYAHTGYWPPRRADQPRPVAVEFWRGAAGGLAEWPAAWRQPGAGVVCHAVWRADRGAPGVCAAVCRALCRQLVGLAGYP